MPPTSSEALAALPAAVRDEIEQDLAAAEALVCGRGWEGEKWAILAAVVFEDIRATRCMQPHLFE